MAHELIVGILLSQEKGQADKEYLPLTISQTFGPGSLPPLAIAIQGDPATTPIKALDTPSVLGLLLQEDARPSPFNNPLGLTLGPSYLAILTVPGS
jgi:hypothetical protein